MPRGQPRTLGRSHSVDGSTGFTMLPSRLTTGGCQVALAVP